MIVTKKKKSSTLLKIHEHKICDKEQAIKKICSLVNEKYNLYDTKQFKLGKDFLNYCNKKLML